MRAGAAPPLVTDLLADLSAELFRRRVNRGFKAKSLNLGAPAGKFLIVAHCLVTGFHP